MNRYRIPLDFPQLLLATFSFSFSSLVSFVYLFSSFISFVLLCFALLCVCVCVWFFDTKKYIFWYKFNYVGGKVIKILHPVDFQKQDYFFFSLRFFGFRFPYSRILKKSTIWTFIMCSYVCLFHIYIKVCNQ